MSSLCCSAYHPEYVCAIPAVARFISSLATLSLMHCVQRHLAVCSAVAVVCCVWWCRLCGYCEVLMVSTTSAYSLVWCCYRYLSTSTCSTLQQACLPRLLEGTHSCAYKTELQLHATLCPAVLLLSPAHPTLSITISCFST